MRGAWYVARMGDRKVANNSASQTFLLADTFLASKNNHGSSHLAHVNMDCPADWYPKLKTNISGLTVDSCQYIPVANVTMHCIIGP